MNKIKTFIISHPDFFTVFGLGILFYIIFFYGIGTYALMDVDETRYVLMARDMFHSRDFLTLYLNGEYFFEKPPLYFWGECISFALFGKVNEFTARFPVALYGTACCYLMYFMGKKIVSRLYGVIAALILATSLEFVILAKFAILDIVVSTCIAFSLCFGLCVYFCKEHHKKYFWWLFYIFSGLAVMAKGIPGFVVPFGSMFFVALASKKLKEAFKPQYFLVGITLFLLIVLPWHIAMFKMHNPLFWNEYVIKHHIARFLGSDIINREQPFYFYFLTILWGFFPWIISCLPVWIKNIRKINFKCINLHDSYKCLLYNIIIALFIVLFFSSSGTKLITYILPIYCVLAFLGAFVWTDYIERASNEKIMNICAYVLGGMLLLISLGGILTPLYLPEPLLNDISTVKVFCILSSFASGLAIILFTKKHLYGAVFASIVIFMALISAHATEKFFEIDYKFGQDDLMNFAEYAKEHKVSLTTFSFGHKYSLLYYSNQPVEFKPNVNFDDLPNALDVEKNVVIMKNKELNKLKYKNFNVIKQGRKFSLLEERE